jgi:U3 small nucleolar RNA-associated protein 10
MLPAFLDLVEKLNEATFKPLFSRLYDWAVISPEESSEGKRLCSRRRGYEV